MKLKKTLQDKFYYTFRYLLYTTAAAAFYRHNIFSLQNDPSAKKTKQ